MNNLDFSNLCRICLTRSPQMIHLKSNFNNTNLIISDVISTILHFSPKLSGNHPQFICSMCLDVLQTAYNLKILFEESCLIIQQCLGENMEHTDLIKESEASVELIAGSKKYNLNDLVIVEDDIGNSDEISFQGFLNNLGKSISATYVNRKSDKYLTNIQNHESSSYDSEDSFTTPIKTRVRSNSLDEYILLDGEKVEKTVDYSDIKYTENDIKNLENVDKDLLESALNLKYECSTCKKIFATELRYKKHMEICKIEYKIARDKKGKQIKISRLQCQYCMKTFKQLKFLNYHIKVTHEISSFPCEICNVKLKTKRAYSYHKITKHSEARHICQYCGKRFATSASLKLHLDIHTNRDTPQCVCPVCGKTFNYKGGLFYHMKQHTNERKYKCEYCERDFYTLFAKKRHVRTHTGIRPYACHFCEKKFFSLGERKRHEYIHTGTLPHRCMYCDKGFTSKYNLKVHWLNHSGDFSCEYCNRRFIDNEVLQFHNKIKHRELIKTD